MAGLDDLEALFPPRWFYSMILKLSRMCQEYSGKLGIWKIALEKSTVMWITGDWASTEPSGRGYILGIMQTEEEAADDAKMML